MHSGKQSECSAYKSDRAISVAPSAAGCALAVVGGIAACWHACSISARHVLYSHTYTALERLHTRMDRPQRPSIVSHFCARVCVHRTLGCAVSFSTTVTTCAGSGALSNRYHVQSMEPLQP